MGFLSDLKGTFNSFFRINTVRLKDNSSSLEIRNSGDSAYANLRCANAIVEQINDSNGNELINLAPISQGRLTLTSNTPVLSSNVTNATTLYYTPYTGSQVSIWDGSKWVLKTFTQLSLSLSGLTANTLYDVFIYNNNNTLTLESVAWSSSGAGTSTRASALTYLNGVRVKSSDNRKYLGSFMCNSTGGQIDFITEVEGTPASNGFFNEFNKQSLALTIIDTTTHNYITSSYRIWANDATNVIKIISNSELINLKFQVQWIPLGLAQARINGTLDPSFYCYSEVTNVANSSGLVKLNNGYNTIQIDQNGYPTNTNYSFLRATATINY